MIAIDRKTNDVESPDLQLMQKWFRMIHGLFYIIASFCIFLFQTFFLFFVPIYFVLMTSVLYQKYKHNSLSFFILIGMQDLTLKQ